LEVAFPPYRLDLTNERLWRAEQEIRLRPKTFAVLRYLVDRPGRLVAANDLRRFVWPDVTVSDSMPRLCIREIRAALRDDARRPRYVETRVGRGYRFVAPVHPTLDPGTAAHPPTPGTPIVGRDGASAPRGHPGARAGGAAGDRLRHGGAGHRQDNPGRDVPGVGARRPLGSASASAWSRMVAVIPTSR